MLSAFLLSRLVARTADSSLSAAYNRSLHFRLRTIKEFPWHIIIMRIQVSSKVHSPFPASMP